MTQHADAGASDERSAPGRCWRHAGVLVPALLFALLTACSSTSGSADSSAPAHSRAPADSSAPADSTAPEGAGSPGAAGSPGTAGSSGTAGAAGSSAVSAASCSGTSCSVVLAGDGSEVEVLDSRISFHGVRDGRAALRVGAQDVSCTHGQSVSSGSLRLECTAVTGSSVEFTVSVA
jgi:hypothetical protein